jgi:UDP-N-acetylglucosamine 4-epimerase
MTTYSDVCHQLEESPKRWLVTGVAGFIGSNLLQRLLELGQSVVGIDNFSTGHRENLDEVCRLVGAEAWAKFHFIEEDIRNLKACEDACEGVDFVLHQAALGSVPRSIKDPVATHLTNVDGTLNMFVAAKNAGVKRVVFASSSSVYGDAPELPKREERTGAPLSPYALTKVIGEGYAAVFGRVYGLQTIGLRYFNVFGARQDPEGPYAAVIPRWFKAMLNSEPCKIFGDGQTSRDFCYVANVVQMNILAATTKNDAALGCPFNVSVGGRTTLKELHELMRAKLQVLKPELAIAQASYEGFRAGDITHSQADITRAIRWLGYEPAYQISEGLTEAMPWYLCKFA